jgi:cell division protein FtsQ
MSFRDNIRKILFIAAWCCLAAIVLVLLVAAINRKNSRTSKGWRVEINDGKSPLYLDQKTIIGIVTNNGSEKLTGKTIATFDLRKMEDLIKKNAWVKDAQLFFDNTETLRIKVTERMPVARIITVSGNSFYMDSSCVQLPLSDRTAGRLPVFTGFPFDKLKVHGADSALVHDMCKLSLFILNNPFWLADIEQISITANKSFDIVPALGNHLIIFGNADDCKEKFHRLLIFYKEAAAKTSFDRYSKVDVRFAGQVIGTRRGSDVSRFDSLQAIKNIQQLIRSSQQVSADTAKMQNIKPLEHNTVTEQSLTSYDLISDDEDSSGREKVIQKNGDAGKSHGSEKSAKTLPKKIR